MLTKEQLVDIRKVIGDIRFMQAAAIVASGLNDTKQGKQYMSKLANLDRLLEQEIMQCGSSS